MSEITSESTKSPSAATSAADTTLDTLAQGQNFIEKYGKLLGMLAGAVVVAGLGWWGYQYYTEEQDTEAQAALFKAVYAFEADSLDRALNGKNGNLGLLAVAEDYAGTAAGNQAHFYAGAALLKKGKYKEAIEHLEAFKGKDMLVTARAYALTGDAYSELKDYGQAVSFYQKAADHYPNKIFSPGYLMKLALAQEANKDIDGAINSYGTIIQKYPEASEISDAKKYQALLQTQKGE